jgi:Amt family ammonium transporter
MIDTGHTAWMLTATALVLFMTIPGLALFYGGLVRTKNVLSVLMQCIVLTAVVSVLWVAGGYSLTFTAGNGWLGDLSKAFFTGVGRDSLTGSIPETVFAFFQLTFAIITPALIIGAFAERMRFSAMLLFSVLWTVLVYFPVAHWMWGGGWLQKLGALDFAGGIVVHTTAGFAGLVTALMLGRRRGFPTSPMPPHSLTLSVTGAGMLWVGWFGFNAGSALAANGQAGYALAATHTAAAAAALSWMLVEWLRHGKPSVLGVITGSVAGLATVTPASGFTGIGGAMILGLLAGVVCFFAATSMKRFFRYDDSLDAFGVHGVGGVLGSLATAALASASLGGSMEISVLHQLGIQALAVAVTAGWSVLATFLILKGAGLFMRVRADEEQEVMGLDLADHEERGYNY